MSFKHLSYFIVIFFLIVFLLNIFAELRKQSVVRVKGMHEINVVADKAFWNISFVNTGKNLDLIYSKTSQDTKNIIEFLKSYGLTEKEITIGLFDLVDLESREYKDPNQTNRYILTQSISVESDKIDLVENIAKNINILINKNISLKSNDYNSGIRPTFIFTKLNDVKEEMLTEAIKNAEKSANQFAKNTKAKIYKIRNADQGTFVILPKNKAIIDSESEKFSKEKQIRVVLTIEYWLK